MHVRHAHAGVKLIVQAELCVGKTASIYIGMHAWWFGKCRDACVACAAPTYTGGRRGLKAGGRIAADCGRRETDTLVLLRNAFCQYW